MYEISRITPKFLHITLKIVCSKGKFDSSGVPNSIVNKKSRTAIERLVLIFRTAKFDMFHVKHPFSLSIRAKKAYPLGNLFVPILSEVAHPVFMLSTVIRSYPTFYLLLIAYYWPRNAYRLPLATYHLPLATYRLSLVICHLPSNPLVSPPTTYFLLFFYFYYSVDHTTTF